MQHLAILPILLPLLAGVFLLLPPFSHSLERQRALTIVASLLLVIIAASLLLVSDQQGTQLYILGDWQPPYGIVLVADRLSTLMVLLTAVLALAAQLYACAGDDRKGMYFHPLFMFQVMGINGAFLTGDIFNLFVFFEILLMASYALLIHGGGKQKTKASVHYVILNLVGSSIFLFALGMLYGTLGSLNIADMAIRVRTLSAEEQSIVKIGGLMLLVVFGLKAAMLPLNFWLPRTYAAASAPVAALFAIMTKVGIYSILRIHTVIFGDGAGELSNIALPWLWPLALLTLTIGSIGVVASPTLRLTTANLVVISVGTLLLAIALNSELATSAALYYMVHSTLIAGALFLIADMVSSERGKAEDRYVVARKMKQGKTIGIAFFIAALAVIGMPPLSGFIGKTLLLQAAHNGIEMSWVWTFILVSSLVVLVSLSRAGSTLFWRYSGDNDSQDRLSPLKLGAVYLLLAASPLLVVFGGPVTEFTQAAAEELHTGVQPHEKKIHKEGL